MVAFLTRRCCARSHKHRPVYSGRSGERHTTRSLATLYSCLHLCVWLCPWPKASRHPNLAPDQPTAGNGGWGVVKRYPTLVEPKPCLVDPSVCVCRVEPTQPKSNRFKGAKPRANGCEVRAMGCDHRMCLGQTMKFGHLAACSHIIGCGHRVVRAHSIGCGHCMGWGQEMSCGNRMGCGHTTSCGHAMGCRHRIVCGNPMDCANPMGCCHPMSSSHTMGGGHLGTCSVVGLGEHSWRTLWAHTRRKHSGCTLAAAALGEAGSTRTPRQTPNTNPCPECAPQMSGPSVRSCCPECMAGASALSAGTMVHSLETPVIWQGDVLNKFSRAGARPPAKAGLSAGRAGGWPSNAPRPPATRRCAGNGPRRWPRGAAADISRCA